MTASRLRQSSILVCIAATSLTACNDQSAHKAEQPVRPALVADVVEQTTQVFGPFVGTVAARYESSQGFLASGRMIKRYASVGDRVGKGQKLASLDQTLLRFAVVRAEADVLNADAQLQKTSAADVRKRNLVATDSVPQSDVDTANADRKTSVAELDQKKAALQKAKDQLGYADLYSTYDGVITAWKAEVGQDISQGQQIVTIAQPDVREAVVDIPDGLIGDVKRNASFDVRLEGGTSATAKGIVREISPNADAATRTRRTRFTLKDPSAAFRLGSTVSVSLTNPISPRIQIPDAAILDQGGKTEVWAVAAGDDIVRLRTVRVASKDGGTAIIQGPLRPGDRVVTAGLHLLKDGQRIKPTTSFP